MATVKYKIGKNNRATTPCPYGRTNEGRPILVGGSFCVFCKYFDQHEGNIGDVHMISCNYAEDVASRNKKPKKQKSEKVINPVKFKCICGHNRYVGSYIERTNPRIRTEVVRCNKCNKAYKLEFTLTNQIVPYQKRK